MRFTTPALRLVGYLIRATSSGHFIGLTHACSAYPMRCNSLPREVPLLLHRGISSTPLRAQRGNLKMFSPPVVGGLPGSPVQLSTFSAEPALECLPQNALGRGRCRGVASHPYGGDKGAPCTLVPAKPGLPVAFLLSWAASTVAPPISPDSLKTKNRIHLTKHQHNDIVVS